MNTLCCSVVAVAAAGSFMSSAPAIAAAPVKADIARQIKADVAVMTGGINRKNADDATRFDAKDIVIMEAGDPPILGAAADKQGFIENFKKNPGWRVTRIDETVDVADAGDMAVYRSTYDEDSTRGGVAYTHRVNFLAGFVHDRRGVWLVRWEAIVPQSAFHKK